MLDLFIFLLPFVLIGAVIQMLFFLIPKPRWIKRLPTIVFFCMWFICLLGTMENLYLPKTYFLGGQGGFLGGPDYQLFAHWIGIPLIIGTLFARYAYRKVNGIRLRGLEKNLHNENNDHLE